MRKVVFDWGVSSFFGWGVYGLNLALEWAADSEIELFAAAPINPRELSLDGARLSRLDAFLRRSAAFQQRARAGGLNGALRLAALGGDMRAQTLPMKEGALIGVTFFESALHPAVVARARALPAIVAGSTWNERLLRAYGCQNVVTIVQGVDPALFCPGPRSPRFKDRFVIFSGGKAELRKGQDLVIAAFRIFAQKHPEALLLTAWHSPWPQLAKTLDRSRIAAPIALDSAGRLDVKAWAAANGINPDQAADLGAQPNASMPDLLRDIDVALLPSRAEGGTNLVAMEAMAAGAPVILSHNTGHRELVASGATIALERQTRAPWGFAGVDGVEGWGESDVDEIVAALERVHADRAASRAIGAKAAAFMRGMTWAQTAHRMKELALAA